MISHLLIMKPLYMSLYIFNPWQTRHEISLFISTGKWWDYLAFSAFSLSLSNHSPSRSIVFLDMDLWFCVFQRVNLLLLLTISSLYIKSIRVLTCVRKCEGVWKCMCLSVCVSACMSVFISMMLIISHNTHVTVTSFKPCKPSATQDPTQDFLYIPPKD